MMSIIESTRDGRPLSDDQIENWISSIVAGSIPDYQVAAWLMAVYLKGLTPHEVDTLTRAMARVGSDPVSCPGDVDKHSTGGVGDKTTLVLSPLVAEMGCRVVKMSGRGLGHTGGTLDKLESIPGFRVHLTDDEIARQVNQVGVAVVAQNARLAPADGILYALRDVTGTVDSLPLIASSIMSKKIAGGAPRVVLDVKVGSGAMMESQDRARELAAHMVRIGSSAGLRVRAVLTHMGQPLGYAVGNALEVMEAMSTLRGEGPDDLRHEVIALASEMVGLVRGKNASEVSAEVSRVLDSGRAYTRFLSWIEAQGGDLELLEAGLPEAPICQAWKAPSSFTVSAMNTKALGLAAQALGAGRATKDQAIDYAVGLVVRVKIGDQVKQGDVMGEIHARRLEDVSRIQPILERALIAGEAPTPLPTILDVLDNDG